MAREVRQEREGRAGEIRSQGQHCQPLESGRPREVRARQAVETRPEKARVFWARILESQRVKTRSDMAAERRTGDRTHADATAREAVEWCGPVRASATSPRRPVQMEPKGPLAGKGKAGQGEPRGVRLRTRTDL
jgi:hypothetical protein